jgi:hypothetical protein
VAAKQEKQKLGNSTHDCPLLLAKLGHQEADMLLVCTNGVPIGCLYSARSGSGARNSSSMFLCISLVPDTLISTKKWRNIELLADKYQS